MAATRLSDAQKQELVSRFQNGENTQELADAYGCSPNTVIRVAKAALGVSGYEELKRQRGRRPAPPASQTAELPTTELPADPADPPQPSAPPAAEQAQPTVDEARESHATAEPGVDHPPAEAGTDEEEAHEAARGLAIDDADDFDEYDTEDDGDDVDLDAAPVDDPFVEVPVSLVDGLDQPITTPRPWRGEDLPSSAYMLVDKTVELQSRPLAEISELGRVSEEELDLQALVLYSNPRQAKRQCGRTQRVIKVPDLGVFARTAPYLLRQGIRRVVLEGTLYALPGA